MKSKSPSGKPKPRKLTKNSKLSSGIPPEVLMEVIAEEENRRTTNTSLLLSIGKFAPKEWPQVHKIGDYENSRSNPEVVGLFFEIASAPFSGSKKKE